MSHNKTIVRYTINKGCGIVGEFMEEGHAESCSKAALFLGWVFGRDSNTRACLAHLRYDRMCSLVPCIKNLKSKHNNHPFLPDDFMQLFDDDFLDKNCADDSMHARKHTKLQCRLLTNQSNDQVHKYTKFNVTDINPACKFHPYLPKFEDHKAINDECCEQFYSTWNPCIKNVLQNASQHRAWWYVYTYICISNEWKETVMKDNGTLLKSGVPKSGGFLPWNW